MPLPPPATRVQTRAQTTQRPPEKPAEALLSGSWPTAAGRRPLVPAAPRSPARSPAARAPSARCAPPCRARSCDSLAPGSARGGTGARLALRLPPETVMLVQRRHVERQVSRTPRPASPARRPPHLCAGDPRATPRVSLLNERHRYDDVEYEDEARVADERLVRKCTEWLRGVETATTRDRAGRLGTLPHLGTL